MMKVDIVFQGVCRICSSVTSVSNLFELKCSGMPVSQLLDICVQHQAHVNDGYPQNMCMSCVAILFHTYNFITMCQKSLDSFTGKKNSTSLSKTQDLTSFTATQDSTSLTETQLENLPEDNYIEDLNLIKEELIDLNEAESVDLNLIKFENSLHELNFSDCDSGSINNVSTTIKCPIVADLEEEVVSMLDGSSHDEIGESDGGMSPEIVDAPISSRTLIQERSRTLYLYEIAYKRFKDWCEQRNPKKITESVLIDYFLEREKSNHLKPSSLWSDYTMLKASFAAKDNIDISKYIKLTALLKRKLIGYRPKKSRIFTREEFYRFLKEAPDELFLLMKVAAIFGIAGGMSSVEFQRMTVDNVEERGSRLLIKLPQSRANRPESFVVSNKLMVDLCLKYKSLRPPHTKHDRFFVYFRNGQCTVQVVGVNTFGKIPCKIAKYLGLDSPQEYARHCFRRSSATLREDSRSDIFDLERFDSFYKASTPAIKEKQEIPRESDYTENEMMIWNPMDRQ